MATSAATLSEDLREYALSLPATGFPKGFYCALDGQLALDAYKLLCCNKAICPSCQDKLIFPTACPSCDHSPLGADSCAPNKTLRNTIRIWLLKQKKKEEKAAVQAPATPSEATPAAPEVQPVGDAADQSADSIEEASKATGAGDNDAAGIDSGDTGERAGSAVVQPNEGSLALHDDEAERRGSIASQTVAKSTEPSTAGVPTDELDANAANSTMMAGNSNPMMANGMASQMGWGFNNGMGFGMTGMNGMSNMMGNANWNGMNSMDYNSMNNMSNGMYGNLGGNMGMGMNDMSAMNYNGGYGGWNGMGGGYGNYNNGFNSMGGYNQSGAYPEMMNQYPKNNFSTQNQNRFPANQGGAYPLRNMRNGNHGAFGPGSQHESSRPGSQNGPASNRDGKLPDGTPNVSPDVKIGENQSKASTEPTEEGKVNDQGIADSTDPQSAHDFTTPGNATKMVGDATDSAGNTTNETAALNPIQTFDSGDAEMEDFSQPMMGNSMSYPQGMMGHGFDQLHVDPSFNSNMNMAYNNYGSRGAYNNGAYGAAKVLTNQPSQPTGVGVVGAPTGPRAMREGRPNTGFSSRLNSARFVPPPKSVTSVHDVAPPSPQRRVRSRSPQRDESMRVNHKSPSRSRSLSRGKDDDKHEHRERSHSVDRESRREQPERSTALKDEDDYDQHKERRHHRSSRYDDRDDDYDERRRDDRASRGNRTRTASVESRYRSSRRDKEKHRSSRSQRDRSKEYGRRHRSRTPGDDKYEDDETYVRGERDSDRSSRRRHRSDKEKYRDLSRDRSRDRKERKDRDRDYDYERSRDKDKDRKRRKGREAEENEGDYDDEKYRSSHRSHRDRDRERSSRHDERDRDDRDSRDEKAVKPLDREDDIVGAMMKKGAASPPLNAPTGPSANGFSIKGRSKNMPPPVQPPTGPRAFQPPKGPAADRNRDHSEPKDRRRRRSSAASVSSAPVTPKETQDHYAAERERNARERNSREVKPSKSLHSRISSSSRPSLSSKRSYDDDEPEPPRGPRANDVKVPTGPSSHRDKRRKSGTGGTGDDNIARLFTAGLRKNAKARRGGVRTELDMEKDLERVERERERR